MAQPIAPNYMPEQDTCCVTQELIGLAAEYSYRHITITGDDGGMMMLGKGVIITERPKDGPSAKNLETRLSEITTHFSTGQQQITMTFNDGLSLYEKRLFFQSTPLSRLERL